MEGAAFFAAPSGGYNAPKAQFMFTEQFMAKPRHETQFQFISEPSLADFAFIHREKDFARK